MTAIDSYLTNNKFPLVILLFTKQHGHGRSMFENRTGAVKENVKLEESLS